MKNKEFLEKQKYDFYMEYNRLETFLKNLAHLVELEEEKTVNSFVPDSDPNLYYNSFVIRSFSYMENYLFNIANYLLEKRDINLKAEKDLSGSSIGKLEKCFFKIMHLDLDKELWKQLDNIRIIRNALVHNESELNENDKKRLLFYINQHYLMTGWSEFVVTNYSYCHEVLLLFNDLIINLFDNIENEVWGKKYL